MRYVLLSPVGTVKDDGDVSVPTPDSPSFPDDGIGTGNTLCLASDGIS